MDFSAKRSTINTGGDAFCNNNINNFHGENSLKTKVMTWSRCSATYQNTHDEAYSSRNPDTGKRFFESPLYVEWMNGEGERNRNLACVGKPGAGKTSTASAVIENLLKAFPSERKIIFYAYFKHNSQSCQTIPIVFSNFLGQIVERQDEPSQPIRKLYQEYAPNSVPRLDKVIAILKSEISSCKRSYVVVDALDEFSLEDFNSSSKLVKGLEGLGAKLLITSRYPVKFTPNTFSNVNIFAYREDLIIYIREQLAESGVLGRLLAQSPKLEEEIIGGICQKCDGMFIIARLLIDSFSDAVTAPEIRQILGRLPDGLDETYHFAMERIDSQKKGFKELARRVIEWVVFAKDKLTVAELRHAVSFKPGMQAISEEDLVQEDDIISVCAGLIIISGGYVQFVHFSTQEFFARFADRYFPDAQRTITETCLRYLALSASTIPPEIEENLINAEEPEERQDILRQYLTIFPLATHAATHWGSHAFDIRESFDHSLAVKVYRFPASPYFADEYYIGVEPTAKMDPLHYQILLCARFGLAVPSLLGPQDLPRAGGVSGGVARVYVDPDAPTDYGGKRPLHFAAKYGHKTVLNLLSEANADVNVRSNRGKTPLSFAAEEGHSDIVGLLLDRGVDPNGADDGGHTPLTLVAWKGDSEIIRMLLESGADPNIVDNGGRTPLAHAASMGHSEAMRTLLGGGADPNIASNNGWTPLAYAAQNRRSAAVRMLLDSGADPNIAADKYGGTPLGYAAGNGHSEVVMMLLSSGADPNIANNDGWTPLAYATEYGHSDVVRMLLDSGVNPNIVDNIGRTPLAYAARNGHSEAVRMLLDGGADPNIANMRGRTPLAWAAEYGYSEIVRMLLDGGADPNVTDTNGWTPLALAAQGEDPEIVRVLLDCGADPDISNSYGETPLTIAEEKGYTDIAKMIRDHKEGRSSKG